MHALHTQPAPLTPEQLEALASARRRVRKVRFAAGMATFSACTMAFFALITLISGIFSLAALLLGIGLAGVAWVEWSGAVMLRRLDRRAPRRLGVNQLALAGMVALYGTWGICSALLGPTPYDDYVAQGGQVGELIEPIAEMHTLFTVVFYGSLIVISAILQGSAAAYYFTRRRHLEACLADTPEWVVQTMRAAA